MSETRSNPEAGIAHAVNDLGEQTADLIRQEVQAVRDEMTDKAKRLLPAAGLAAVAGGGALFASASLYRLLARMLEKLFGQVLGAAVATAGFGAVAFLAGSRAVRLIRTSPAPIPSRTVGVTRDAVSETVQAQTG